MNVRAPISYRPSIEREWIEALVLKKLRYKAGNRFIDETVKERKYECLWKEAENPILILPD